MEKTSTFEKSKKPWKTQWIWSSGSGETDSASLRNHSEKQISPPPKKGKSVVDPSGGGETAGILVFRLGHLHVLVCIDATPLQHLATRLQHVASAVSRLYFISEVTALTSQKPNLYVFVSVLSYFWKHRKKYLILLINYLANLAFSYVLWIVFLGHVFFSQVSLLYVSKLAI